MSDLLPNNATDAERALSEATGRDIPVPIRQLWNPATCPADLLPWLAWAVSVDDWNPQWTDEQKRGAIAASLEVHKIKGTAGALRAALDGIGYQSDATEWFQKSPIGDPYTFDVMLTLEQTGIPDNAGYQSIENVINSAKNLRSHLTALDVTAISRGSVYFGGRFYMGETVTLSAEPAA